MLTIPEIPSEIQQNFPLLDNARDYKRRTYILNRLLTQAGYPTRLWALFAPIIGLLRGDGTRIECFDYELAPHFRRTRDDSDAGRIKRIQELRKTAREAQRATFPDGKRLPDLFYLEAGRRFYEGDKLIERRGVWELGPWLKCADEVLGRLGEEAADDEAINLACAELLDEHWPNRHRGRENPPRKEPVPQRSDVVIRTVASHIRKLAASDRTSAARLGDEVALALREELGPEAWEYFEAFISGGACAFSPATENANPFTDNSAPARGFSGVWDVSEGVLAPVSGGFQSSENDHHPSYYGYHFGKSGNDTGEEEHSAGPPCVPSSDGSGFGAAGVTIQPELFSPAEPERPQGAGSLPPGEAEAPHSDRIPPDPEGQAREAVNAFISAGALAFGVYRPEALPEERWKILPASEATAEIPRLRRAGTVEIRPTGAHTFPRQMAEGEEETDHATTRPRFIQLDDLPREKAAKWLPFAFLAIETRDDGRGQVWMAVECDKPAYDRLRRRLVGSVGSDVGASGAMRWPGSAAKKGGLVRLTHLAYGRATSEAELERAGLLAPEPKPEPEAPQPTKRKPKPTQPAAAARVWPSYEKAIASAPRKADGTPDYSRGDASFVRIALMRGFSEAEAEAALERERGALDGKPKRNPGYCARTVRAVSR